jgi:hypothetical protein
VSYAIEYDFIVSNGRYIPFGEIIRDGNNLHIAPVVIYADSGELEAQKSCNLKEYSITENSYKTLTVALTSDYNVSHTAVDTFHCQFFDTMPQTTTSERLYQIARNTSTDWQKTSATNPKINYTHFDNGTGWQLYGANKIARCIYHGGVEVAASGHTYIRCVGQYDTLSEAEADTSIPDMPVLMSEHTEFLATIIFNVSNASQQLILYDKSKLSTASASNDYNNLVNRPDLTVYALISNLVSYVGNWSLDKPNYYTSSEVDILDGFKLDINDQRYNDSAGFNNLNWSKINSSTFPVACPAGTAVTQINNSITCTSFNQGYQISAAGWVKNTGNISTS